MNYPNRNGRFVGVIVRAGFVESRNNAVMYHVDVALDWEYSPRDENNPWLDVAGEDMTCPCDVVLITKDGKINEAGVRQLKEAIGFDGDWKKLRDRQDLINAQIQVQVKGEEYQGQMRYKGAWLYPPDAQPGELIGEVQDDAFDALATRFGAQTRAIISGNSPRPGGSPQAPNRQPPQAPNQQQAPQAQGRPPFDASKAKGAAPAPAGGAAPRGRARTPRGQAAPAATEHPQDQGMPPVEQDQAPWVGNQ